MGAPGQRLTRTQRRIDELRRGDGHVVIRDATGRSRPGVPVWVELERHEFPFGCVVPDSLGDVDRQRYHERLQELFNCTMRADSDSRQRRLELPEPIHLGRLRRELDGVAPADEGVNVHVWGQAVGMAEGSDVNERDVGKRVAELYTLCFAHPAVAAIFWNGLADGNCNARGGGLLRRDLAPKYAYQALRKLIGSEWHSRAAGVTDAAGAFWFRGFFGDYRVGADLGETAVSVTHLAHHRPT